MKPGALILVAALALVAVVRFFPAADQQDHEPGLEARSCA